MLDNKITNLKTPCYIIDQEKFENNLLCFKTSFIDKWGENVLFGYSIKTNNCKALLEVAKCNNMFAEAVSDDEYHLSLSAGYSEDKIIFNGPQKGETTLLSALKNGGIVNLDNMEEIRVIKENISILTAINAQIGLRVNFDLEKECPGETTAGSSVSRFGFCVENGEFEDAIKQLRELKIPINGLHMHYSTKSRSARVFKELAKKAKQLIEEFDLKENLTFIDIGGGFFLGDSINTEGKATLEEYSDAIVNELIDIVSPNKVKLILEPGAALISTSIDYLTKVINKRTIRDCDIVTVDGSLLHLNPFLANRSTVLEVIENNHTPRVPVCLQTICGATCMENDRFTSLTEFNEIFIGDYIKCKFAGAYTMCFNSNFINTPPYIYLKNKNVYRLVRNKLLYKALLDEKEKKII